MRPLSEVFRGGARAQLPFDARHHARGTLGLRAEVEQFGVRVVLWRSRDPITEADAFRTVLNGENSPWGVMLNRTTDHYFSVTASDQSFDPGASAEFTVKAPLADLGFPGGVRGVSRIRRRNAGLHRACRVTPAVN